MQASGPLEDDSHDGKQALADGLPKAQQTRIEKQLKHHDETLNVELVTSLAHDPRGIPVAVSRADASLEQVLASAPAVQNRVPELRGYVAAHGARVARPHDRRVKLGELADRGARLLGVEIECWVRDACAALDARLDVKRVDAIRAERDAI